MYITADLTPVNPRKQPYNISFNGEPDTLQTRDGSILYRVLPARAQPTSSQVTTDDGFEIFEGKAYRKLAIRDKTSEEIIAERTPILEAYRDEKALVYTYKGVPMKLGDGARADLTALYFTVLVNQAIPDETVMADWQEEGYDPLPITAGDLRTDGFKFAEHRQKCFTASATVKPDLSDYVTEQAIKDALDAAYSEL